VLEVSGLHFYAAFQFEIIFMLNNTQSNIISFSGAALVAYGLGKFAHNKRNRNIIVAGYAIAGLAIGGSLTSLALLKTNQKPSNGWNDLTIPIYLMGGAGILTISALAGHFWKK